MKRLLVVTYYWPPAGGVSVQRVLKFCKYLPRHGWQPIVLTADSAHFETIDEDNSREAPHVEQVMRVRAWEPHGLYRALGGRIGAKPAELQNRDSKGFAGYRTGTVQRLFERLSEWIRLNIFIPDSRIPWYPPAVRAASRLISEYQVDLIYSTAPPFTVHLAARRLSARHGIPWVADFRDPWVDNTVYNRMRRLNWVLAANRRLERLVLRDADCVVCTGQRLAALMRTKLPFGEGSHISVVEHGYDRDNVRAVAKVPSRLWLSYFGSLYEQRFPEVLFDTIARLAASNRLPGLAVRIYGTVSRGAHSQLAETLSGTETQVNAPLPQNAYQNILYEPQVLLLSVDRVPHNDVITLGKAFDYLPTGNPVLGVGPLDGDIAQLLRQTGSGRMFDYEDRKNIEAFLVECWEHWKTGRLNSGPRILPEWERSTKTARLAELLDGVLANPNRRPGTSSY